MVANEKLEAPIATAELQFEPVKLHSEKNL